MLNEVLECKNYFGYTETGLPPDDATHVRVLRILARHYWHELPAEQSENEKVRAVAQKLEDFYKTALVDKIDPEEEPERLKAVNKRLKRYRKPFFEYSSRFYTFYSIIADAVNDGPLNGAYEGELLKKSELAYLLELADKSNRELWDKLGAYDDPSLKKAAYNKQVISNAVVARIAALIVYFRRYAAIYAVKDGYLPVSIERLNNWLGSKYLEKGKNGQGKWAHAYDFIDLQTRDHPPYRDDGAGSSFLKIDEEKLAAGAKAMLEDGKPNLDKDADAITFPDNNLSKALTAKIKELRSQSKNK